MRQRKELETESTVRLEVCTDGQFMKGHERNTGQGPKSCFPSRMIDYLEALTGNQAPSMESTVTEGRVIM